MLAVDSYQFAAFKNLPTDNLLQFFYAVSHSRTG